MCIETGTDFTSTFHDCFQVCIVVSEVPIRDDEVIGDRSYSRDISEGLIKFPVKDILRGKHTEGKP